MSYQGSTSTANFAANANANISSGGAAFDDSSFASRGVQYACGDCDSKVTLKKGDPIRCKECGHRVLYKERTNRMVQFEAR